MKNFLSLSEHFKEFFVLIKKHGPFYFLMLFIIYLAFYLNSQLFVYLLKPEINNFEIYPTLYAWVLIGFHTIIAVVINYFLFKLFLNLLKALNSQKQEKTSLFNIFSFWSFFHYIFLIYVSLLLIINFGSIFELPNIYFHYLEINISPLLFDNLFRIVLLIVILLASPNLFTLFKSLNNKEIANYEFVRHISRGVYWPLIFRIFIFVLLITLFNLVSQFFGIYVYNFVFLAFLLLFYLSPIYKHRVEKIDINDIKEIKYRPLVRIILYFFLIIILFLFFLLNTITLLNKASYKPIEIHHGDLLPVFEEVAASDNAFVYFFNQEKIKNVLNTKDDSFKSSNIINQDNWDQEYVDEVISENEELLEHYIYTINHFSYWQNTNNPCASFKDRELIIYSPLHQANRLYNLKALNYLNNNQIENAWNMAISDLYFTGIFENSNDVLDFVIFKAIRKNNFQTLNKIIAHEDFLSVISNEKIDILRGKDFYDNNLPISALKSEYCHFYYETKDFFAQLNKSFSYYINDCNNYVAGHYRGFTEAAESNTFLETQAKSPKDSDDYPINYLTVFEKNSLCKIIAATPTHAYLDIIRRNMANDILYKLTIININFQKFEQENNRAPSSLDELVLNERYLIDNMNGEELYFDADNLLVWSVGRNGINDEAKVDDIVLDLNTGVLSYN